MKKFLTIFGLVLLVLLGIGGYLLYQFLSPDEAIHAELETQFSTDFFSFNEILEQEQEKATANQRESEHQPATEESIIGSYEPAIRALEQAALNKIDELLAEGYQEYRQKQEEGSFEMLHFAKKYTQAADKLEKSLDTAFYGLLAELEQELNDQQLPTSKVKEFEEEYKAKIKELRSELMNSIR